MKVLFIGSDRSIFEKESQSYKRMREYGRLFDELHIVIFNKGIKAQSDFKIAENVFVRPTNSFSKLSYVIDAYFLSASILGVDKRGSWVVSVQDPFESGIIGFLLKLKFKIKLQVQVHTDFLNNYFKQVFILNRVRLFLVRFVLPNADRIRVVSSRIKDSIVAKYNLKSDKIDVLPIYTNVVNFQEDGPEFRFKNFKPDWRFVFLTVCRLEKEKNLFFLLDVFKELSLKRKDFAWILVGDGSLKPILQTEVEKLGLDGNVSFLGQKNDLPNIYRGSDFYIQSSFYEGFGLSILEAFLCGLPVLTTDVGLIGSILNKKDVFTCDLDKVCFLKIIEEFIAGRFKREDFSKRRREILLKLPKNQEEYLNNYKTLFDKIYV